jgi:hypothetical protein
MPKHAKKSFPTSDGKVMAYPITIACISFVIGGYSCTLFKAKSGLFNPDYSPWVLALVTLCAAISYAAFMIATKGGPLTVRLLALPVVWTLLAINSHYGNHAANPSWDTCLFVGLISAPFLSLLFMWTIKDLWKCGLEFIPIEMGG